MSYRRRSWHCGCCGVTGPDNQSLQQHICGKRHHKSLAVATLAAWADEHAPWEVQPGTSNVICPICSAIYNRSVGIPCGDHRRQGFALHLSGDDHIAAAFAARDRPKLHPRILEEAQKWLEVPSGGQLDAFLPPPGPEPGSPAEGDFIDFSPAVNPGPPTAAAAPVNPSLPRAAAAAAPSPEHLGAESKSALQSCLEEVPELASLPQLVGLVRFADWDVEGSRPTSAPPSRCTAYRHIRERLI